MRCKKLEMMNWNRVFFPYKFDADEANKVCEVCKWYIAD